MVFSHQEDGVLSSEGWYSHLKDGVLSQLEGSMFFQFAKLWSLFAEFASMFLLFHFFRKKSAFSKNLLGRHILRKACSSYKYRNSKLVQPTN